MDELQQNIVRIQKNLTFSMFEIKEDVKNYLTIHMFKHKESLDDDCSTRITKSTNKASCLSESLENAVTKKQKEMTFNWEGDLDQYNNEISRQLEELEGFQEELQKIIWESWEVLDKTPPNRCKKCDFIVEGKKPSKVKQRIESHFKKSHKEYYQIHLEELETERTELETLEVDKETEVAKNTDDHLEKTEVPKNTESLAEEDEDVMEINIRKLNTPWYIYENSDEEEYSDSENEYDTDADSETDYESSEELEQAQEEIRILKEKLSRHEENKILLEKADNIGMAVFNYEITSPALFW